MRNIFLGALLLASAAYGQNFTSITAANLFDASGARLASGQLCVVGTDGKGNSIPFHVGGGGMASIRPVCRQVLNGGITAGSLQVASSDQAAPLNIAYVFTVTDDSTGETIITAGPTQVTGTSWSLDAYQPSTANLPVIPATPAASISIGTTTTGLPGAPASVTNVGTATGAVLNFTVPAGPTVAVLPATWTAGTVYKAGQTATYNGQFWQALLDSTAVTPGTDNTRWTVTTQLPISVTDISTRTAVTAFGDSNTVGYGLSTPTTSGYIYQFAAARGWTLTNKAVSGSMCADQASAFMAETPGTNSNYTFNLGYNDMRVIGTSATQLAEVHSCLEAGLSYLALPSTQFTAAQSATVSGTWTNATLYGIAQRYTAQAGATIQFSTGPSETVYLYGISEVSNFATFSVSIDGVARTCNAQTNTCSGASTFTEHGTVTTVLGKTFAPQVWRFSGLANQSHTVLITSVAPDVNNFLNILGIGWAAPDSGSKTGPSVLAAEVPRMNASGYASDCVDSYGVHCNLGSDSAVAEINERIHAAVSELASDGLQITSVEMNSNSVLNPNDGTMMQSDNVHFSAAGHLSVANAFISQSTSLLLPRERGSSQTLRNVASYRGSFYVGGVPQSSGTGQLGSATSATTGAITLGLDGAGLNRTGATTYVLKAPSGITKLAFGDETSSSSAICFSGAVGNFCKGDGSASTSLQSFRVSMCTTGTTIGSYCDTLATYPAVEPDTSFSLSCTLDGTSSNAQGAISIYNKGTNAAQLRLTSLSASANTGVANCILRHD